jgi:hypothetical protein
MSTEPALEINSAQALPRLRTPPWERRLRGLTVALPCWAIIAIGATLSPRSEGHGTHQQLGLPACGMVVKHHLPCPTCGLTTSVACLAHGQVAAAFRAQAFGPFLFVGLALFGAAGLFEALTGRDGLRWLRPGRWCVWVPITGALIGWGAKLATGFACGQLPFP